MQCHYLYTQDINTEEIEMSMSRLQWNVTKSIWNIWIRTLPYPKGIKENKFLFLVKNALDRLLFLDRRFVLICGSRYLCLGLV